MESQNHVVAKTVGWEIHLVNFQFEARRVEVTGRMLLCLRYLSLTKVAENHLSCTAFASFMSFCFCSTSLEMYFFKPPTIIYDVIFTH